MQNSILHYWIEVLICFYLSNQINNKNSQKWLDSELFDLNFGIKKMIPESKMTKNLNDKLKITHLYSQTQQKSNQKNHRNNSFQFFILLVKKIRSKKLLIKK